MSSLSRCLLYLLLVPPQQDAAYIGAKGSLICFCNLNLKVYKIIKQPEDCFNFGKY